jgi:hypothetical protein
MTQDPAFATEIYELVRYLDQRHGRIVIEPEYPSNPFVVVLLIIGVGGCVTGLGLFGYTFFHESDYQGQGFPPGIERAFAIFFAGFVTLMVAGIVHGFTRR